MIYDASVAAIVAFAAFVLLTLGISFYLGRRATSSEGYFAAHGQIPWAINGVAFAGDYLSAASFLGICGMIASYGYDGFLYSIGYLAGWVVALFVIAEPMKRLGRFTFADALDAKFQSPGIRAAAGVSTLVVSVFYLIPQMVGAGVLIQPLLGLPHWIGVVAVGAVVIVIVVTAGMVSTTWVQFLKGSLLVIFSAVLVAIVLSKGLKVDDGGFQSIGPLDESEVAPQRIQTGAAMIAGRTVLTPDDGWSDAQDFIRLARDDDRGFDLFRIERSGAQVWLRQAQSVRKTDAATLIDGAPLGRDPGQRELLTGGYVSRLPDDQQQTGPLGPAAYLATLRQSEVVLWKKTSVWHDDETMSTIYYPQATEGSQVLRPGEHPRFQGIRGESWVGKINFLSLMLALFCGTASLPHILIRYYTVKDAAAARKSTIVGIATIGFFYVLTLYLGLGAMTNGALDLTSNNMAAPLLARSFNDWLFAIISAIAFTTVLGTVSGLILASSGAVAHDLLEGVFGLQLSGTRQVRVAKISAVIVGIVAIVLGILFQGLNLSYLVGWAFSVAASANLPSLVMLLFWKRTTRQGIVASILVGMFSSLAWVLLSADTFESVYGIDPAGAPTPFGQPGIVTIPLAFLTLIVVSLMTGNRSGDEAPVAG
ncbi:cation acetate symporter [Crateriforma conspicua]|uniref:Cation/acetate symporter ActP n=1 Tax=Crateriforma conspicua TaxID=2527996 RepID=A0A5C6FSS8_9PLAN|nr:cation acetate symporter [Crateriforma conspicua]TWU65356.1 Cation/acetate symporter ActP [Crateriforma conspicua]